MALGGDDGLCVRACHADGILCHRVEHNDIVGILAPHIYLGLVEVQIAVSVRIIGTDIPCAVRILGEGQLLGGGRHIGQACTSVVGVYIHVGACRDALDGSYATSSLYQPHVGIVCTVIEGVGARAFDVALAVGQQI